MSHVGLVNDDEDDASNEPSHSSLPNISPVSYLNILTSIAFQGLTVKGEQPMSIASSQRPRKRIHGTLPCKTIPRFKKRHKFCRHFFCRDAPQKLKH